jgi:hypothetical protein
VIDFGFTGAPNVVRVDDDSSLQLGTGAFAVALVLSFTAGQTTSVFVKDQVNGLNIALDQNVNVITPSASAHAPITQGAWHVILVRGPALEVRVDGVPTKGTTSTSDLSAPGQPVLAGTFAGSNAVGSLEVMQVVAYKGAVSDAQAEGLEAYFKNKYGF